MSEEITEKMFHDAHMLARWIGFDQFKTKLPLQESDWIRFCFDFSQASTAEEAKQYAIEHFRKSPKYKQADESSIKVHVHSWPTNTQTPAHFYAELSWRYLENRRRECTFQTVAAVEVSNEENNPLVRTFRILGCSRGQNSWGESMWFNAATMHSAEDINARPVSAIKETSMDDAIKLLYRRVKQKTVKALGV